jgi:hypothetical protein
MLTPAPGGDALMGGSVGQETADQLGTILLGDCR